MRGWCMVRTWKILRAPMMADTMTESPGSVSTMSAAPRAASVAPAVQSPHVRRTLHTPVGSHRLQAVSSTGGRRCEKATSNVHKMSRIACTASDTRIKLEHPQHLQRRFA